MVLSTLRFFNLHDLMSLESIPTIGGGRRGGGGGGSTTHINKVTSLLLVESDNLLYGDIRKMLPQLRYGYPHLAGVVQSTQHFTASVFWVCDYEDRGLM